MLLDRLLAYDCHRFVRRKIMLVIFQRKQVERGNQAIGRIASRKINLMIFESSSQQAQIHNPRLLGETKCVSGNESAIAIGTLDELIAKSGAPLGSECRCLR